MHIAELAFLGTASQSPSVHRGLSSILMKLVNDDWLFDCGEGTAVRRRAAHAQCHSLTRACGPDAAPVAHIERPQAARQRH